MTHFGIICPALTGHLNPMTTLGHELQRRGHRVTLFGILDARPQTLAAGLEFWAIGEAEFPAGASAAANTKLGELSGLAAFKQIVQNAVRLQAAIHRTGGVSCAADLVEQVAQTGQPVLAQVASYNLSD